MYFTVEQGLYKKKLMIRVFISRIIFPKINALLHVFHSLEKKVIRKKNMAQDWNKIAIQLSSLQSWYMYDYTWSDTSTISL